MGLGRELREKAGWLAITALAFGSVLLHELGVEVYEAYTLPSVIAAVAIFAIYEIIEEREFTIEHVVAGMMVLVGVLTYRLNLHLQIKPDFTGLIWANTPQMNSVTSASFARPKNVAAPTTSSTPSQRASLLMPSLSRCPAEYALEVKCSYEVYTNTAANRMKRPTSNAEDLPSIRIREVYHYSNKNPHRRLKNSISTDSDLEQLIGLELCEVGKSVTF